MSQNNNLVIRNKFASKLERKIYNLNNSLKLLSKIDKQLFNSQLGSGTEHSLNLKLQELQDSITRYKTQSGQDLIFLKNKLKNQLLFLYEKDKELRKNIRNIEGLKNQINIDLIKTETEKDEDLKKFNNTKLKYLMENELILDFMIIKMKEYISLFVENMTQQIDNEIIQAKLKKQLELFKLKKSEKEMEYEFHLQLDVNNIDRIKQISQILNKNKFLIKTLENELGPKLEL